MAAGPSQHKRSDKVSDAIHRELAELLRSEVKDPRLSGLTLTQVELTPDMAHAKVYVSHPKGLAQWPGAETALKKATGFLRSQLGGVLSTYSVPTLKFIYDQSLEQGIALSGLIDRAIAEDKQHPHD
jgi:ribosome-binding factor A